MDEKTVTLGDRTEPTRVESDRPSDAQLSRLWRIVDQARWEASDVMAIIRASFHKTSARQLTWCEYESLCDWIQKHSASGRVTSGGEKSDANCT